jgi:hypothetical protein
VARPAGVLAAAPALALALTAVAGATAQAQPVSRAQEAAAMLAAAGFQIRGAQILNPCGRPAQPRPTAVDLNGDGKPEAVVMDVDAGCYGGTGEGFSLIQSQGPGRWTRVGTGRGRIKILETRTNGWRDWSLEGSGCQRTWSFQTGQGYVASKGCAEAGGRVAQALPATPPGKAGGGMELDERPQALKAAGFSPSRGRYPACDPNQDVTIEIRDLNGDGRPDGVVTDYGLACYGGTEQGFVLVTKDASGAWRKLFATQGIPEFLPTRGVGGWPDIVNGGPGFCFPVMRWNGRDYAIVRWRADPSMPNACAGRR